MIGPCLCGDIYCSSCGDPAAAEAADYWDEICDELNDLNMTKEEMTLLLNVGLSAVLNARDFAKGEIANAMESTGEHVQWLQDRLAEYTDDTHS